jgi:DNA repair exonuclease SbcCD ATPase subunit
MSEAVHEALERLEATLAEDFDSGSTEAIAEAKAIVAPAFEEHRRILDELQQAQGNLVAANLDRDALRYELQQAQNGLRLGDLQVEALRTELQQARDRLREKRRVNDALGEELQRVKAALSRHHAEYTHGPGASCPVCQTDLRIPEGLLGA